MHSPCTTVRQFDSKNRISSIEKRDKKERENIKTSARVLS